MVKLGPTNPLTIETVRLLRKTKAPFWKRVAELLEKRTRAKVEVNLSEISRHAKDGESVVVPGKLLGTGEISGKISVCAKSASKSAVEKIKRAGGKFQTLDALAKENPKGKGLRLII